MTNKDIQKMIVEALENWDFVGFPEQKEALEAMLGSTFEQYEIDENVASFDDWEGFSDWVEALAG